MNAPTGQNDLFELLVNLMSLSLDERFLPGDEFRVKLQRSGYVRQYEVFKMAKGKIIQDYFGAKGKPGI